MHGTGDPHHEMHTRTASSRLVSTFSPAQSPTSRAQSPTSPAQSPGAAPLATATSPEFEAATIKPVKEPDPNRMNDRTNGRHFFTHNTTLRDLILMAYGVDRQQIAGGRHGSQRMSTMWMRWPAKTSTSKTTCRRCCRSCWRTGSNSHFTGNRGTLCLRTGRCKGWAKVEVADPNGKPSSVANASGMHVQEGHAPAFC